MISSVSATRDVSATTHLATAATSPSTPSSTRTTTRTTSTAGLKPNTVVVIPAAATTATTVPTVPSLSVAASAVVPTALPAPSTVPSNGPTDRPAAVRTAATPNAPAPTASTEQHTDRTPSTELTAEESIDPATPPEQTLDLTTEPRTEPSTCESSRGPDFLEAPLVDPTPPAAHVLAKKRATHGSIQDKALVPSTSPKAPGSRQQDMPTTDPHLAASSAIASSVADSQMQPAQGMSQPETHLHPQVHRSAQKSINMTAPQPVHMTAPQPVHMTSQSPATHAPAQVSASESRGQNSEHAATLGKTAQGGYSLGRDIHVPSQEGEGTCAFDPATEDDKTEVTQLGRPVALDSLGTEIMGNGMMGGMGMPGMNMGMMMPGYGMGGGLGYGLGFGMGSGVGSRMAYGANYGARRFQPPTSQLTSSQQTESIEDQLQTQQLDSIFTAGGTSTETVSAHGLEENSKKRARFSTPSSFLPSQPSSWSSSLFPSPSTSSNRVSSSLSSGASSALSSPRSASSPQAKHGSGTGQSVKEMDKLGAFWKETTSKPKVSRL